MLNDPRSQLFRKVGGTIMPYALIVDQTGTILNKHTGYNLGDEVKLEKEIVHILGLDSLVLIDFISLDFNFGIDVLIFSFDFESSVFILNPDSSSCFMDIFF